MAGVITASEPSWIASFAGLSPRQFGKLVTHLRRKGADTVRRGRPWSLPLEDRVLLVAAYWRTNLTMRQLAPLLGVSKSAADRIVDHLGPMIALRPRERFGKDTTLIVDGTLVPTRDHTIAAQSKNYRYSANHQPRLPLDRSHRGAPRPRRYEDGSSPSLCIIRPATTSDRRRPPLKPGHGTPNSSYPGFKRSF